jgi:hypothetical protein
MIEGAREEVSKWWRIVVSARQGCHGLGCRVNKAAKIKKKTKVKQNKNKQK